jgi:hypothetical protein
MIERIERKILAHAAVLHPGPDGFQKIWSRVSPDLSMDHLVETAIREGLGSHLYKSLKRSRLLESLAEREKQKLETHYYQVVRNNSRLIHDLKEVLRQSHRRNIRPVLLQGMDLIQGVYDDIGLRPMTDIDLWVLKKDHQGFVKILLGSGYESDPLYPNSFRRGSTTVDLHTHLLWADRIRARQFLLSRTDEEIYCDSKTVTWEGEEAQCLNQNDQVIYLALHALKHRFNRLIWLVDIKNITAHWRPSEWEAFRSRAKELGQPRILSCVLFLLSHVFGYQPPKEVRSLLIERLSLLERRALMERVNGHEVPVWAPPFLFSSDMDRRSRLSFIFESLFPRPEILQQVFPSSQARPWQLYLRRIFQILHMASLSLRAVFIQGT